MIEELINFKLPDKLDQIQSIVKVRDYTIVTTLYKIYRIQLLEAPWNFEIIVLANI